jgi:hypothetical protein
MSFHQALVDAFYAAAVPTEADRALLASLSDERPVDLASIDAAAGSLGALRRDIESATRGLWDAARSGEGVEPGDLDKLIDLADRWAAERRARHEDLVRSIAIRQEKLRELPAANPDGARLTKASEQMLDLSTTGTDILVRFYYELLALRAEIEAERPTRIYDNVATCSAR